MAAYLVLALVLAFAAYVRLAPTDPARWNVDPAGLVPADAGWGEKGPALDAAKGEIVLMRGGAHAALFLSGQTPEAVLERLAKVAGETPRTVDVGGDPATGRMTWETRSLIWGFPDYTTAEAKAAEGGTLLLLVARQRFGSNDHGVNGARLRDWLSRL